MRRPQTVTEIWGESILESKALNGYTQDLIDQVSMPDLYKGRYEWWWNIINCVDPEYVFKKWRVDYMSYTDMFSSYWKGVTPEKNRFDLFVLYLGERDGPQGMVLIRSLSLVEARDFCRAFRVNRTTALKMMSLYTGKVILEPKWKRIV